MGFTLLDYNASAAGTTQTNLDLTAVTDPEFSVRNGHYIFTQDYKLGGLFPVGASLTRGRVQVPTWNAIGEFAIFNVNRSLNPPSNGQWDTYLDYPPVIPQMEEFQVQVSNNLAMGTEQENVGVLLLTGDWNANIQRGRMLIPVRATFTVTPTINVWSGGQALTLSQSLRGGVYSVAGAMVQGTNAAFFRMIFPRAKMWQGRKLRPGLPLQNALGDVVQCQMQPWMMGLGEWGRFHTFELPQIELLGTTAGSITYQVFLWLAYMGEDVSLLSAA